MVSASKARFTLNFRQVVNSILSRASLLSTGLDGGGRDLNKECGYPDNPDATFYRDLYEREGIAARVVGVYPDECWSIHPELYETEEDTYTTFERAWDKLNERLGVWHYLHRADEISGIGHYGVLYLGLDDGNPPDQPVRGLNDGGEKVGNPTENPPELLYLRPFDEYLCQIAEFESDPSSPRHGQAKRYNLKIFDPSTTSEMISHSGLFREFNVHWTRVIHVADNRKSSEVFGTPRLKPVLNRLLDIRKIYGGSAEMFWKGGFPGYSFETHPDNELEPDEDAVREEILSFQNGLQRYLTAVGGSWKSLAPQVADPTNHVMVAIQAICAALGVPFRVFLGSEAGHLASDQDTKTWNRRLARRQTMYLEPKLIKPFVNRLSLIGVLPTPKQIYVSWRDLNSFTDKDRADFGLKTTQSLLQYVTSGAWKLMPPKVYMTLVLRYTDDEADAVIEKAGGEEALKTELQKLFDAQAAKGAASKTPQNGLGGKK